MLFQAQYRSRRTHIVRPTYTIYIYCHILRKTAHQRSRKSWKRKNKARGDVEGRRHCGWIGKSFIASRVKPYAPIDSSIVILIEPAGLYRTKTSFSIKWRFPPTFSKMRFCGKCVPSFQYKGFSQRTQIGQIVKPYTGAWQALSVSARRTQVGSTTL